jgi:hypothetical protein
LSLAPLGLLILLNIGKLLKTIIWAEYLTVSCHGWQKKVLAPNFPLQKPYARTGVARY